jgi:hypothetical protein
VSAWWNWLCGTRRQNDEARSQKPDAFLDEGGARFGPKPNQRQRFGLRASDFVIDSSFVIPSHLPVQSSGI